MTARYRRIECLALALAAAPCFAALADVPPARLSGIVVSPADRVAIFAEGEHGVPTALREGDALGPWQIRAINPDSVLIAGPSGPLLLELQAGRAAAEPQPAAGGSAPSALAAAQEAGMSIGRLATHHDACIRRGFAAPSGPGGEDQLRAMLNAMYHLPARTGEDAPLDAPTKELAVAMQSGWEAAVRAEAGIRLDAAACGRIGELWKQAAPRYGLQ